MQLNDDMVMSNLLLNNAPTIHHWLVLSTALFSVGLYGLLTRRNVVGILISVELMLNAVALNFVIFNQSMAPSSVHGKVFVLFVIAVAAAEAVIAMGIFVALFRQRKTVDVTQSNLMQG